MVAETNKQRKAHFQGLSVVAQHVSEQLIVPTQDAYAMYKRKKETILQGCQEILSPSSTSSINAFEIFSKHINLVQVYLSGKAYLMQFSPHFQIHQLKETIESVVIVKQQLNDHIFDAVGKEFQLVLRYMDSKRDTDTLEALMAKSQVPTLLPN